MSLEQLGKVCCLNANPVSSTVSVLHVQECALEPVQAGVVASHYQKDNEDKVSWLFSAF